MERSLVIVLTVVNLVTATPHGYGVKGGASAKAEANAVAGAYGGLSRLPLSIPSGSSYSGSFAKSSSSSFASSSASSSSSSFSFSGSGANGIAGIGTDKGCSSGTCPGVGATGLSSNGGQQFTGANAVSAAQAKALSGTTIPCQGSSCNGSPAEKCSSGQCLPDYTSKDQKGCAGEGNCQLPSSEIESLTEDSADKGKKDKQEGNLSDSNDFAININRNLHTKSSHDSNGQYSNKDISEPDCSNGKCDLGIPGQSGFGNNQNKYPVPSTFLTTPNINPPCTTPNCKYPSQNSGLQTGGLPSSYNVPIQSATNPPHTIYSSPAYGSISSQENSITPGVLCTSPGCNSTPYKVETSKVPNFQFGQQGHGNQGLCASGQCDNSSPSNGNINNGAVSDVKIPNYTHGSIPSNAPAEHLGQPGCTTPFCSGLPTYSNLPTNQPGNGCSGVACSGSSLSGTPTKVTDSNAPVYTGGFGGPPGFLDINSGLNKVPGSLGHDYSHNTPSDSRPTGSIGSIPTLESVGTNNPNGLNSNSNYGSAQTSSIGGLTESAVYNKPSSVPSTPDSQFKPSFTTSYGAPTVSLAPGSLPQSENNGNYKPTTSHFGSSPTYSGSNFGFTGLSQTSLGSNSIHGSYGVTKPNISPNPLSTPANTGGFGGPSSTSGSSLSSQPTGSLNKPDSGNCGLADCIGQSSANLDAGSSDKTSLSTSSSSQNKPIYTGGFGGPTGFLNSNNDNVPSNPPAVSSGNIPCANGNCGSKGTLSSGLGTITGAHNLAAATASANAVIYSGGFGGPPGVLKPHDGGKVNIPAHGNGFSLSSNNEHTPSVIGKNSELGKPGGIVSGGNAAAHASATATATAGSYGGNNNYQHGASGGCNSGCSPNGGVGGNIGSPDGLTKNGLGAGSLASAKSSAGADVFGDFSSSSATAHASAGAFTKGGYGRK